MAKNRIKGITIELDGKTTGLQNALKDVNKKSIDLQSELKDVEKLLKFDPGNTEALAQKQQLLSQQIENTEEKLKQLKDAQEQVKQQFESGDIGAEQYRAFQREIQYTEATINKLKAKLSEVDSIKIDGLSNDMRDLERATDQVANTVDDVMESYDRLEQTILSQEEELSKLKKEYQNVVLEQGKNSQAAKDLSKKISNLSNDLKQSKQSMNEVETAADSFDNSLDDASVGVKEFGNELVGLAAGAAVVGSIGEAVEQALDTSSLNTKIDISMEVSEESKQAVKEASNIVQSYGVDSEAALEGIRRQWALNADASDESNAKVVQGAAAICAAYGDVDFTELIQESNELSDCLGITDEQAIAMVDSLLKIGFPADQLDIITEYGSQLARAGYSAEEVQAIMAAGVETGTWNIDVLLDGLKEGRIVLAEFGQGVDEETAKLFEKVGISGEQLQKWGQAVAEGGEGGKTAMQEVAKALDGVKDKTLQNQIGTTLFGTLWEENGTNITDTILGMNDNLTTSKENMDGLNSSVETLNSDPAVALSQAVGEIKIALEPVMLAIAGIVLKIAEWVQAHPQLSAAIIAIVAVIAVLVGILTTLAPIFTAVAAAAGALGIGVSSIALPLIAIVAVIAAVVAAGVLLYQNWDKIKAKASELSKQATAKFNELKTQAINKFNELKNKALQAVENLKNMAVNKVNSLKTEAVNKVTSLKNDFVNKFTTMKTQVVQKVQVIKDGIINKLKSINLLSIGKNIIQGLINGIKQKASAVKNACKDIANSITKKVKGILGIHSPSAVFMEIGEYTGEGLVRGLDSKIRDISNKSAEMSGAITSNFRTKNAALSSKELDYSKLGIIMLNSFKEAITSTGMDNLTIVIDKTRIGKAMADVNDRISGERLQLAERWQL